MPTQDGLDPAHPLSLVYDDETEQQEFANAYDQLVSPWRVFKASILIATAVAGGIVVLSVKDPVALFANVTASLVGSAALQPASDQSNPTIQSSADAPDLAQSAADTQATPPTATDTPPHAEIAAAEPAGNDQAEKNEPPPEALFRQFQAWAAEKDAQADVRPAQPVQDAPAQAEKDAPAPIMTMENARAPHRFVQRHRRVPPVQNARAEMRTQNLRRRVQPAPAQTARAERPPIQDPRAPDPSMQNAQTSSFLPIFSQRN